MPEDEYQDQYEDLSEPEPDDPEVARTLAAMDVARMPVRHFPAPDPPPDLADALRRACAAEGADTSTGRFAWRVTTRVVEDVDGIPTAVVEHRNLVFTNCRLDTP
jgi:hypothetical protein